MDTGDRVSVQTGNLIYLSVPRTASRWTREVLRAHTHKHDDWGEFEEITAKTQDHSPRGKNSGHCTPSVAGGDGVWSESVLWDLRFKKNLFTFCMVRHPLTWYRSYWIHKVASRNAPETDIWNGSMQTGQAIMNDFDRHGGSRIFGQYIDNVIEYAYREALWQRLPLAGKIMRCFTPFCDFVGKYENLKPDLIKAIELSHATCDMDIVNTEPPRNDYGNFSEGYDQAWLERYTEASKSAKYTTQQAKKILKLERELVEEHGYDYISPELVTK